MKGAWPLAAPSNLTAQNQNGTRTAGAILRHGTGYDANTNLVAVTNRLTSVNGKAVTHDSNGNLIGLGSDSYRFDFDNRLLSYAVGGVFGGQHRYDGLGDRLQHTTNGVTRRFVLDRLGSQLLAETDGGGSVTVFYVYGLGLAQRITPDGQTDTYHFDLRGSTVLLTSATGEPMAAYAYDSFGTLADSDEDRPQPFRYLGRYGILDDGNGLYHARARYFSPHLGRFISQDPLWGNDSSSQSFNRYVYALNNPLRYLDATGLAATEGHVPQYDPETAALEAEAAYQEAFDEAFRGSAGYYVLVTTSVAGDIAGGLLDLITGSPKTAIAKRALVRFVVKHGDDAADLLKLAKEGVQFTKSSLKLGQEMHKAYKAGLGDGVNTFKEFNKIKGIRPDFVDFTTKTIYELKPNNPRAIQEGLKQLDRYKSVLEETYGSGWKTVLDTY